MISRGTPLSSSQFKWCLPLNRSDETEMTLVGFLAFLDPPKASAGAAIARLRSHGTAVKVITGDNPLVAATVRREVGIDVGRIVLGPSATRS